LICPAQLHTGLEIIEKRIEIAIIKKDLEIHEARNTTDRNRRFGATRAIIKVTKLTIKSGL